MEVDLQPTMAALGQWLLDAKLITEAQLAELGEPEPPRGAALATAVVERKLIKEQQLVELLSERLGVPSAPERLHRTPISPKALGVLPEDLCWQHNIFPFGVDRAAGTLQLAMLDPTDDEALSAIRNLPGLEAEVYIIGPRHLERAIRKHYMDSWIDETGHNRRRFFGYDNLTDPGLTARRVSTTDHPNVSPASPGLLKRPAHAVEPEPALPSIAIDDDDDDGPTTAAPTPASVITPRPPGGYPVDELGPPEGLAAAAPATPPAAAAPPSRSAADARTDAPPAPYEPAVAPARPLSEDVGAIPQTSGDPDQTPTPTPTPIPMPSGAPPLKRRPSRVQLARLTTAEDRTTLQHRVAVLERTLTELLELFGGLKSERISSAARDLKERLRKDLEQK